MAVTLVQPFVHYKLVQAYFQVTNLKVFIARTSQREME